MVCSMELSVYKDNAGKYRWRCHDLDKLFPSRSAKNYRTLREAKSDIDHITSEDHEPEIYTDKKGKYRWRFKRDGKIIVLSSKAYYSLTLTKYAASLVLKSTVEP